MNNRNNTLIVGVSIVLWCAIIWFSLKDINPNPWAENSITVQGEGKSNVVPNIFVFSVSANETGSTTKAVNEVLAKKLDQAQKILADNGIEKKDIQSNNINTYENREYNESKSVLNGYRGNHTLTIKVRAIESAGKIMDQISTINGLLVQWGTYENDDESAGLADARSKAFDNAKSKAEELAKLAGLRLWKALSINEYIVSNDYNQPMYKTAMADARTEWVPETTINPGERELQVQLNIIFETK